MQYDNPISRRKRTKSKQKSKNSRRTSDYSSLSSSSQEDSSGDKQQPSRSTNRNHSKKQNKIDIAAFPEVNQLSKQSSMKSTLSKSPLKANEISNQVGISSQGTNSNNNLQSSISQIQNQLKAIRSRVDNIGTICTQDIAQVSRSSSGMTDSSKTINPLKLGEIRSMSRSKTPQIQDSQQSQRRQSKRRDKSDNPKNRSSHKRQNSKKDRKRRHKSYKQHSSCSSLSSSSSSSSASPCFQSSSSSSRSSSISSSKSRSSSKDKPIRCRCSSRRHKSNHNKFIPLKSQLLLHLHKLNYESRHNILLKSILQSKSSLSKSSKLSSQTISVMLKDTLEAFVDYAQRSNFYLTKDHSNAYSNMTNFPNNNNNHVINIQQFSQVVQPKLQRHNWIIEQAMLKQQQQAQQEDLQQLQQQQQQNLDNSTKGTQSESKLTAQSKKHRSQTNADQLDQQSTPQNKSTSNSKNSSNNNKASDSTASTATQAALRSNQEFILAPQQLSNTTHSINTLSKNISSNSLNQTPWNNNNNNRQKGSFSVYEPSSGTLDDDKFRKIYLPQKFQKERIMEFGGIYQPQYNNSLQSNSKSSTYEEFYQQQMQQKQLQMQLQALTLQQQQKVFWEQQQNHQFLQQPTLNSIQPNSYNISQQTHQKVPSMLAPFDSFMCPNPSQDKASSFVRSSNPSFDFLSPQFKDFSQSNEHSLMHKGLAYPVQMDSFNALGPYSSYAGRYKQFQGVYLGNQEVIMNNQHSIDHNNINHPQNSNNSSNGLTQNANRNNSSISPDNLNSITGQQQQQQPEDVKASREEDEDDMQGQLSCRSELDKDKSVASSSLCRESSSSWKPQRSKQTRGLLAKQQSEYFQSPENTPTSIRSHNSKVLQQIGLMPCHRINKSIGPQNNQTNNNNTISSNSQANNNNTNQTGPALKRKYSENSIQSVSTQYFANSTTVSHTLSPRSQKHQKQQQKMCKQCQILNNRQEVKKDMQKLPPCIDQVERKARNVQVAKNTMKDIINMESKNNSNTKQQAGNN